MNQLPVYQIDAFKGERDKSLFYVNSFRKHLEEHGFVNKAHGHNFYLTVLFTSGFGIHEVDFTKYAIVPGSLFILKPGQVHFWKFSKNIEGYILFHSADFFHLLYNERSILSKPEFFLNRKHPTVWFNRQKQSELEVLFQKLTTEYSTKGTLNQEKVCTLTFLIYLELTEYDENNSINENQNVHYLNKVRALEILINKNFHTLKFPYQYADLINITPKHLNRISKSVLGVTVSHLIIHRIVLEGKRLLINPRYSIALIAEKIGYDDPSYFAKVFKKTTGISPNNFRNA